MTASADQAVLPVAQARSLRNRKTRTRHTFSATLQAIDDKSDTEEIEDPSPQYPHEEDQVIDIDLDEKAPLTAQEPFEVIPQAKPVFSNRLYELWLTSRLKDPETPFDAAQGRTIKQLRDQAWHRPFDMIHLKMAMELCGLIWPRFWSEMQELGWLTGFVVGMRFVLNAFGRPARLWSECALLELVQVAMEGSRPPLSTVYFIAAIHIFVRTTDTIDGKLRDWLSTRLDSTWSHTIERKLFQARLNAPLSEQASVHRKALLVDAEVFVGRDSAKKMDGTTDFIRFPEYRVSKATEAFAAPVSCFLSLMMLLRALFANDAAGDQHFGLLILLSLGPNVVRIGIQRMNQHLESMHNQRWNLFWRTSVAEKIEQMTENIEARQEIILYGTSGWFQDKWEQDKQRTLRRRRMMRDPAPLLPIFVHALFVGFEVFAQVLIILGTFGSSLSLGSVRMLQSTGGSIVEDGKNIKNFWYDIYQGVFYYAGYVALTSDADRSIEKKPQHKSALIDYTETRTEEGMTIETNNLCLTYPNKTEPVLRGINLKIRPGESLAIVGVNGGGKTTLIKALLGLYDHTGDLLINGVPVEQYDTASLHARTACLFQDFAKYGLSLRENVGLGRITDLGSDDQLELAVDRGGAKDVVSKVGWKSILSPLGEPTGADEDGSDSADEEKEEETVAAAVAEDGLLNSLRNILAIFIPGLQASKNQSNEETEKRKDWLAPEKDGSKLSGGQWQRVALARAFLRAEQADLIVFDEPSSALDPKAEHELFQRIHALSHGNGRKRTTIFISHRFCTVRRADRIAVVDDGRIVELGTHDELMQLDGQYAEFFNLQKGAFEE